MTVIAVEKDPAAATMTVVAEFDANVDRVWQMWSDPRKLERWWGPPMYPATVTEHALEPGAMVRYSMTGPEGDRHFGWWRITEVTPPHRLAFEDGFADEDGTPNDALPRTGAVVTIAAREGGGARMEITSRFGSTAAMEQLLAMGMEEGIKAAVGQIDGLLAE
jgi:uncharacterized protein YndB with AHSA1/START domain